MIRKNKSNRVDYINLDTEPKPIAKSKRGLFITTIAVAVIIIISISAVINNENNGRDMKDVIDNLDDTTSDTVTGIPYQQDLIAGNYTVGVDIPIGTYTLTAISGSGNVSSSNMYNGGLNELMGVTENNLYISTFSNAKLEDGVILYISGNLVLNIDSDATRVAIMSTRTNSLTETINLVSGNYVAGVDFPAGVYNVVAVSGNGNVSSSNLFDGGLNEIMGTGGNDIYIGEFKNADLAEGVELYISGVSVQLVPSIYTRN